MHVWLDTDHDLHDLLQVLQLSRGLHVKLNISQVMQPTPLMEVMLNDKWIMEKPLLPLHSQTAYFLVYTERQHYQHHARGRRIAKVLFIWASSILCMRVSF
jgi:hypothetical protein